MRSLLSRIPRFQTILALVALAIMLRFAVHGAYCEVFCKFEPWDDEGYLMISAASCARGFALYDEVFSQYGPFYYLMTWLGFELGPLELDHATVRWLVMYAWLAVALGCAALVWTISRNAAVVAITFAIGFRHLFLLATEPAHPQALIVICLTLVVLVPAWLARARPRLCCILLGGLGAAITLTKINVGVYVMLALVLAILEHMPATTIVRWIGRATWAAAMVLPAAVMHDRLTESWALLYAALVTGSVILLAFTLRISMRSPLLLFRARDALAFGAAFTLTAALCSGFALMRGTSLRGLLDGVLLSPLTMAEVYVQPLSIAESSVLALVASLCLWIVVHQLSRRAGRAEAIGVAVLAAARLGFGVCVLRTSWLGNMAELIELQAPLLWLIVFPSPGGSMHPARVSLALVAALQLLHAFPVAGSQTGWATFLMLPAAAICLADAWQYVALRARGVRPESKLPTLLGGAASIVLVLWVVGWMRAQELWRHHYYYARCPLDLPGTGPLRIEEDAVAMYGCLTRNIRAADAFYGLPGLGSFYFWSRRDPPTTLNATSWYALFTPAMQSAVRASLEPHRRLLVLEHPHFSNRPVTATPDPDAQPLAHFIRESTDVLGSIGPIEVRARRGWTPELVDCARIERDVLHVRVASRPGERIERIVVVDCAKGVVLADSAGDAAAAWQVQDEAGAAAEFRAGEWDLARDRHFTLHDEALLARIGAARAPIVRLLDARSEVVARLPFLR